MWPALTDVREEMRKLPQRHEQLWDLFKQVRNKKDMEQFEQLLADEAKRQDFYERLRRSADACIITIIGQARSKSSRMQRSPNSSAIGSNLRNCGGRFKFAIRKLWTSKSMSQSSRSCWTIM